MQQAVGEADFRIRDPGSGRPSWVVHVNRVKPCPSDIRQEEGGRLRDRFEMVPAGDVPEPGL